MATRQAILDYRTTGVEGATARVVTLDQALKGQAERAARLAPNLKAATVEMGALAAISQSGAAKITSLTNTIGPLGAGLGAITRNAGPAALSLIGYTREAEKAALLHRTLNVAVLGGASAMIAGSVAALAYADDALRAADSYATLHARIRTFSDGAIATAQAERTLYQTARDARTSVGDLATLYTRLSPAVKDYGRNQQDAMTITKLASQALAIQGADIREQAAATVQFSQSIASGVLRGDELRSLLESAPQLLRYISSNLEINGKVGVAFSSLRKLGEAGALSTDKIIAALLRAQPQIEADFINAPKTAQQGWVVLKDQITRTVGTIDATLGGQQAVVKWLGEMATKADAWRQKMALDPHALDPVKEMAGFIGDAVASIGSLGKIATDNFDKIVIAGQGILALKLGSVMASWFAAAAQGAKSAYGDLIGFQQAARFQAGATQKPVFAQAATAARAASTAADIAATEKAAAAELAQARALGIRSAADKAQAATEAARRVEAEAQARAQAALAKVEKDAGRDIAAAQRLKGEAAEIRARLEEDANRRIAASEKSRAAASGADSLSKAGIGTAGSYYGKLAQEDARAAAMLTDQQRQQQLARLREIEVAEARAAATIEASEHRKAAAVVAADAEMAAASSAVVARQAAEAESSALVAAAERSETQAKGANVAATNAAAAASLRNTVAQEAELLVTAEVTTAMVVKQGVMKVSLGLYNLLGGAVGVATLAIGGLIWAVLEAKKAEEARYEAMRQSVDITDRLKASTDAMAAATWAEIPGIIAKTAALREQDAVQRQLQSDELKKRKADLAQLDDQLKRPLSDDEYQMGLRQRAALARDIERRGGIVDAGARTANESRDAARLEQIIAATKQKADAQAQIARGTDAAGRPLSSGATETLKAQIEENTAFLRGEVDNLQSAIKIVDDKIRVAASGDKVGLGSLRTKLGAMQSAASEGVLSGAVAKPTQPTAKPKKISVPGGVSSAYDELLKAGFLNLKGGEGYAASNSKVSLNGSPVTARSEDEATALAKYVKVVESLNDATDKQLKKKADELGVSVRSRAELKAAAGAILAHEMATSKAAQADDRWADIQAEMTGQSRATIKAERELNDLVEAGAKIKDDDMKAYRRWIAAKEAATEVSRKLQLAQPVVQRGFERVQAGQTTPTDSRGVIDEVKATQQLMAARAAVMLDRDRAVREAIARLRAEGQITEVDEARKTEEMKAGYAVAVEISTQDQLLEIRKARLSESLRAQEEQARETADIIVGALRDVSFGGNIADVGKRLGQELLSALYDELLFNPLRDLIKGALRDLMTTQGGGSGSGLFKAIGNAVMMGLGSKSAASSVAANVAIANNPGFHLTGMYADGRVPGFADGRLEGATFRGRGGPRGDDNLVRISDGESIINAKSTRMYGSVLDAINRGVYNPGYPPGFADGHLPRSGLNASPGPLPAYSRAGRGEGDVILNNMSGVPMQAQRRTDEKGNLHIDLRGFADEMARSAGRSGELRKGLAQTPQPKLRG